MDASSAVQVEKTYPLAEIRFTPTIVPVGGVPVVLEPIVTAFVRVKGEAKGGLTASVVQRAHRSIWIDYRQGHWTRNAGNPGNDFDSNFNTQATARLRGSLGANVKLRVEGFLGPYLEPAAYVSLERDSGGGCHNETGVEIPGGIDVEFFDHVIASYDYGPILNYAIPNTPPCD